MSSSAASTQPSPAVFPAAAPPPSRLSLPAPAGAPPPGAALASLPPLLPAGAPPELAISTSPTLSMQSSSAHTCLSGSPPPSDVAALAARLHAAHEHVAALLEGALHPLSPLRHSLSSTQATALYACLNRARGWHE